MALASNTWKLCAFSFNLGGCMLAPFSLSVWVLSIVDDAPSSDSSSSNFCHLSVTLSYINIKTWLSRKLPTFINRKARKILWPWRRRQASKKSLRFFYVFRWNTPLLKPRSPVVHTLCLPDRRFPKFKVIESVDPLIWTTYNLTSTYFAPL